MYDFFGRTTPLAPGECPTVNFVVNQGTFAGQMSVQACVDGTVLVTGFKNGIAFTNQTPASLGAAIEGRAGFGAAPNPTGDSFFDVLLNTSHVMWEIGVPLTQTIGGGPQPGGVYSPSPAFWGATDPGLALSSNIVAINTTTGADTVVAVANPSKPFPGFLNPGAGQQCIQDHVTDTNGDGYSDADQATPAGAPTCTGAFPSSGGLGQNVATSCPGRAPGSGGAKVARADVNLDVVVNLLDLAAAAAHYRETYVANSDLRAEFDQNGDGVVNIIDLAAMAANYKVKVPPC